MMKNDLLITIIYIIGFLMITILWSRIQLNRYIEKSKKSFTNFGISYFNKNTNLVGEGDDGNTDVAVSEAISRLDLPKTLRIEPYEYEEE